MKSQILESIVSKSIKEDKNIIGHKLHNNPLSYRRTHCDFEFFDKNNNVYLIECKETKVDRFPFSRFTQMNSLIFYDKFSNNIRGYFALMFRKQKLKDSDIYFIPVKILQNYMLKSKKRSLTYKECFWKFKKYKVEFDGKLINLSYL